MSVGPPKDVSTEKQLCFCKTETKFYPIFFISEQKKNKERWDPLQKLILTPTLKLNPTLRMALPLGTARRRCVTSDVSCRPCCTEQLASTQRPLMTFSV